jgi:hypothetical protein
MTEGAEEFLSKISREEFWNYVGIKACLIKDSKDKVWKVAFIDIQLLDESKVYENTLYKFENLIFVQKIIDFNLLNELLEQIIHGQRIEIADTNASLEWIKGRPRYDFKMRAYVKQEFHIDNACHILIKAGEYPNGINKIIQNLEASLSKNNPPYRNLKDAVSSLLGIEFGTPAISPFVRLVAPVYVKIEESKATIEHLKILVSASLGSHLSKIRLEMFGEDENAKQTEFRESITTFTRDEDSELLKPIEITVGNKSRYVKLNLHYGDELLEDYYITIPKLVHREIREVAGTPQEQVITEDSDKIFRKKQEIKDKYNRAKTERDKNRKGLLLEQTISEILALVSGLKVTPATINVVNDIQEIDILVRNYNKGKENVWSNMDSVFFVECKNWSKKAGADILRDFKGKLDNKGLKSGIFVAPKGVTGRKKIYGADGQIDKFLQKDVKIIVLDDNDLCDILNCKDITDKIDDKFIELYKL